MKATKLLEGKTVLATSHDRIIATQIVTVYPSGRFRIIAVSGNMPILLNESDIRVVDDACTTLEDFKEKYPEEFI